MGKNNENRDYMMQGATLEHVTQEKDLGSRQDNASQISGKQIWFSVVFVGKQIKNEEVVLTRAEFSEATSRIVCSFGHHI